MIQIYDSNNFPKGTWRMRVGFVKVCLSIVAWGSSSLGLLTAGFHPSDLAKLGSKFLPGQISPIPPRYTDIK